MTIELRPFLSIVFTYTTMDINQTSILLTGTSKYVRNLFSNNLEILTTFRLYLFSLSTGVLQVHKILAVRMYLETRIVVTYGDCFLFNHTCIFL